MRTDKPDVDDPIRIVDPDHYSIFVAGDVEDRTTVFENAGAANIPLNVCRLCPVGLFHLPKPGHRWLAGVSSVRTSVKKSLDRAERNNSHRLSIAQSHFGTKRFWWLKSLFRRFHQPDRELEAAGMTVRRSRHEVEEIDEIGCAHLIGRPIICRAVVVGTDVGKFSCVGDRLPAADIDYTRVSSSGPDGQPASAVSAGSAQVSDKPAELSSLSGRYSYCSNLLPLIVQLIYFVVEKSPNQDLLVPDALELLKTRRSVKPREMTAPGPSPAELETILTIGARVPDHGKLAPWRFIIFEGDARERAGEVIAGVFARKNPNASPAEIDLERRCLTDAPLVIGVVSFTRPHPKVPPWEQELSAGASAMNIVTAATALGFGACWLTGWFAFDRDVLEGLGLKADEKLAGFIHIGTPSKPSEDRPRPALSDIVTRF